MNPIASALNGTTLGIDVTVDTLTMFPLLAHEPGESGGPVDPLVLDEALSSGWAQVTEISQTGRVPELRVANKADRPVFILDGEELVGAKQNRVVNLSLLVPPRCALTIPVSCVEAGRWHARSRAFSAAPRAQYAAGRAMRMQHVTESMVSRGDRRSDQSAVWADISAKSARLRAHSDTAAMEAMFVTHAPDIEIFVEGLLPVAAQAGAVFAIREHVAGIELFQSPAMLRKLLPKIVRSYALDAIDPSGFAPHHARGRRGKAGEASLRAEASMFLAKVAAAETKSMRALGLGEDVRVAERGVTAAALVYDTRVVHLSAFAAA